MILVMQLFCDDVASLGLRVIIKCFKSFERRIFAIFNFPTACFSMFVGYTETQRGVYF